MILGFFPFYGSNKIVFKNIFKGLEKKCLCAQYEKNHKGNTFKLGKHGSFVAVFANSGFLKVECIYICLCNFSWL